MYISGILMSGISNYLFKKGIDFPVVLGKELSNTLGIMFCTLEITSFIIFALNCSELRYL